MKLFLTYGSLTTQKTLPPVPAGKKWRIISGALVLTTGTGSGTRSLSFYVFPGGQSSSAYSLATIDTSSASTTTNSMGSVTGVGGNAPATWQDFPVVGPLDVVVVYITLVSGDTYSVLLDVEEEEDE